MPTNKRDPRITKSVESFARGLLTTTCLTVACTATAGASIITEGTPPAPLDFLNTANGNLLPFGTTVVNGVVTQDDLDFFEFQGLSPATPFSFSAQLTSGDAEAAFYVYNSSGTFLGGQGLDESTLFVTGSLPSDGYLVAEVLNFDSEYGSDSYSVGLTAATQSSAPEPGTLGSMGLAVAGGAALAWRRKRNQFTNAAGDSLPTE